MNTVYLILGSNIENRMNYLQQAGELITINIGGIEKYSSVYETEPWGFAHKSLFLNQVLLVKTEMGAESVLSKLLKIEELLGRTRTKERYTARTIDIDILFYNDLVLQTKDLIIPHPEIQNRRFVLMPLVEIAGDLFHPVLHKSIKELLDECKDDCEVIRI